MAFGVTGERIHLVLVMVTVVGELLQDLDRAIIQSLLMEGKIAQVTVKKKACAEEDDVVVSTRIFRST